jgi:hypothetical protein
MDRRKVCPYDILVYFTKQALKLNIDFVSHTYSCTVREGQ